MVTFVPEHPNGSAPDSDLFIWVGGSGGFPPSSTSALSSAQGRARTRQKLGPHAPLGTADANSHHHLCSWPAGWGWMVPPPPPSGELTCWRARGARGRCSLAHQFIRKGRNSGAARWKRCVGRGTGKARTLLVPLSPTPCASLKLPHSRSVCLFLWRLSYAAGMIKSLAIVDRFRLQPLPSPELPLCDQMPSLVEEQK